jgi:hypothetical protein
LDNDNGDERSRAAETIYGGLVAWHEMEEAAFKFERNYEKE